MSTINPLYVHYMQTCALHAVRVLGRDIATSKRIGQRKFSILDFQKDPLLVVCRFWNCFFHSISEKRTFLVFCLRWSRTKFLLRRSPAPRNRTSRQWHAYLARFFQQYVALQRRTGSAHIVTKNEREIIRHFYRAMPRWWKISNIALKSKFALFPAYHLALHVTML